MKQRLPGAYEKDVGLNYAFTASELLLYLPLTNALRKFLYLLHAWAPSRRF